MNKKLKGTYAQNVSVLLYMHRMYLFKCEMNDAQITVPPGLSEWCSTWLFGWHVMDSEMYHKLHFHSILH